MINCSSGKKNCIIAIFYLRDANWSSECRGRCWNTLGATGSQICTGGKLNLFADAKKGEEWEVQEILNHRGAKMADLEYKIKRVGYDESTWEPIEYLKGTSIEFLRKFHQENGLRVYKWMV
jgi:hypothetical protein